jgi:hypothetical protein
MHKRHTVTVKNTKTGKYRVIGMEFQCDDELLISRRFFMEGLARHIETFLKREYKILTSRTVNVSGREPDINPDNKICRTL